MGRTACTEPQCLYKGALYLIVLFNDTVNISGFIAASGWMVNPFPIQYFCQPHTPQLLFVLGGKEVGGLITCNYPTVLKETNMGRQKEYNLRYLLAKVRTT
jgi:hypothetical protein